MVELDETHDPALRSWVESANEPGCDFPIQNLPLGVFRRPHGGRPRLGVAIGDFVLDLRSWLGASMEGENLNGYFRLSAVQRRDLRRQWSIYLRQGARHRRLTPRSECEMLLPAAIGGFTDFYASRDHALNVGRLLRPNTPLLPNYQQIPIGYHGRTSSIVLSGTRIRRPLGQLGLGRFGPTHELDYEAEIGAFVGRGNLFGEPIQIEDAQDHLAGVCLLNDWSARDIQRWEYQPLGPFLAKNFATSISPWVVTAEALEPFRVPELPHDQPLLPYLRSTIAGAFDITLEVWLRTGQMEQPICISRAPFRNMYWTFAQMLTHHASNGCPLRPGDLLGSGTVSGPQRENRGCLLELASKGIEPLRLPNGEQRSFLEDGDEVILRGYCKREGFQRIGFGECSGIIQHHHV